jgi:hypothetical protein
MELPKLQLYDNRIKVTSDRLLQQTLSLNSQLLHENFLATYDVQAGLGGFAGKPATAQVTR